MTTLTDRQQEVLDVVAEVGENPRLIGERLGITRNGAAIHLRNLREKGALPARRRKRGGKRANSNGHKPVSAAEIRRAFGAATAVSEKLDKDREEHTAKLMRQRDELVESITFHEDQARQHEDEAAARKALLERVEHDIHALNDSVPATA